MTINKDFPKEKDLYRMAGYPFNERFYLYLIKQFFLFG